MIKNTIFLAFGVAIGVVSANYYAHPKTVDQVDQDTPTILWNDDWESIPMAGELVEVEIITQDTIYIGPLGE